MGLGYLEMEMGMCPFLLGLRGNLVPTNVLGGLL